MNGVKLYLLEKFAADRFWPINDCDGHRIERLEPLQNRHTAELMTDQLRDAT